MLLLSPLVLGACSDGPMSARARAEAAAPRSDNCTDEPCGFEAVADPCVVKEGTLNPQNAYMPTSNVATYTAGAIGRTRSSNTLCSIVEPIRYEWSVTDPAVARLSATSSQGQYGYADVVSVSPGTIQVSVTMSTPSIDPSPSVTKTTYLTVQAPTGTPVVGSISGQSVITSRGYYEYSVPATGGDGTYTFYWERSTDAGATWHPHATTSSASPGVLWFGINGGEYFQLRVRAASGNSVLSSYSAPFTVDARSTPTAEPLAASIWGAQEAPANTWCTWTAVVSGGTAPFTYSWAAVGTGLLDERISGATYSAIASHGAIELWLTVRDLMGQTVEVSRRLDVGGTGTCPSA